MLTKDCIEAIAEARLAKTSTRSDSANYPPLEPWQQEPVLPVPSYIMAGDRPHQSDLLQESGSPSQIAVEYVNEEFNQLEDLLDWPGDIPSLNW